MKRARHKVTIDEDLKSWVESEASRLGTLEKNIVRSALLDAQKKAEAPSSDKESVTSAKLFSLAGRFYNKNVKATAPQIPFKSDRQLPLKAGN